MLINVSSRTKLGANEMETYVIVNIHHPNTHWNNDWGWTSKSEATHFTLDERNSLNLPMEGKWKKYVPIKYGTQSKRKAQIVNWTLGNGVVATMTRGKMTELALIGMRSGYRWDRTGDEVKAEKIRLKPVHNSINERARLAETINKYTENGKVMLVSGGMDCDGYASYGHTSILNAYPMVAQYVLDDIYQNAEGPTQTHFDYPSNEDNYKVSYRDFGMEAYEDGHMSSYHYSIGPYDDDDGSQSVTIHENSGDW
jgi:hypothetical protein